MFNIIAAMGVVLSKYHTVSELLKLLSNDTLDTGEKISIILTLGHCTEVCGKIFFFLSVSTKFSCINYLNGIISSRLEHEGKFY